MTGKDWPPLVPYRPGEEEKLPEILPDLPPTVGAKRLKASEDEAKNRAISRVYQKTLFSKIN